MLAPGSRGDRQAGRAGVGEGGGGRGMGEGGGNADGQEAIQSGQTVAWLHAGH